MENSLILVANTIKDAVPYVFEWCIHYWNGILAYAIPYALFYIGAKILPQASTRLEPQEKVLSSLSGYSFFVNFLIIPQILLFMFDCTILFYTNKENFFLCSVIFCTLYTFSIYKSIFMLLTFKKNACTVTQILLCTFPFVYVFFKYLLLPFDALLDKPSNPFGHKPDYILAFTTVCFFSVPYILFFAFSKRIKAAWADTNTLPKDARVDPYH